MVAHEKMILTVSTHEPDGHGFLSRIGALEKVRMIENRLLSRARLGMLDQWIAAAQSSLRECVREPPDPVSRGMCSKGWDL